MGKQTPTAEHASPATFDIGDETKDYRSFNSIGDAYIHGILQGECYDEDVEYISSYLKASFRPRGKPSVSIYLKFEGYDRNCRCTPDLVLHTATVEIWGIRDLPPTG